MTIVDQGRPMRVVERLLSLAPIIERTRSFSTRTKDMSLCYISSGSNPQTGDRGARLKRDRNCKLD